MSERLGGVLYQKRSKISSPRRISECRFDSCQIDKHTAFVALYKHETTSEKHRSKQVVALVRHRVSRVEGGGPFRSDIFALIS